MLFFTWFSSSCSAFLIFSSHFDIAFKVSRSIASSFSSRLVQLIGAAAVVSTKSAGGSFSAASAAAWASSGAAAWASSAGGSSSAVAAAWASSAAGDPGAAADEDVPWAADEDDPEATELDFVVEAGTKKLFDNSLFFFFFFFDGCWGPIKKYSGDYFNIYIYIYIFIYIYLLVCSAGFLLCAGILKGSLLSGQTADTMLHWLSSKISWNKKIEKSFFTSLKNAKSLSYYLFFLWRKVNYSRKSSSKTGLQIFQGKLREFGIHGTFVSPPFERSWFICLIRSSLTFLD